MTGRASLDKWLLREFNTRTRKRDLVPALLELVKADIARDDLGRPVVQRMIKIIPYACRELPVDDPRREGLLVFGH